jgi:uncharacterized phage protein (TIGR02218 family)
MSYVARENSVNSGQPIELYRFVAGMQRWTYTSAQNPVDHDGDTYKPITIRRAAIEQTNDLNRTGLDVTVPRDADIAAQFIATPPDGVVSLTLFRRHAGDTETIVLWKGRILTVKLAGSESVLRCEPVASALRRTGLRARYQLLCRHALYSSSCKALREIYQIEGRVHDVSGTAVQVDAAASMPDGYFVAGYLQSPTGARMSTAHRGKALTLVAPMTSLAEGESVRLYAGCDHSTATCLTRFNNIENFGGFPFIPTKNPFSGDAIV